MTFVAATAALTSAGLAHEGYMVAVAAVMETPAILVALWLARRHGAQEANGSSGEIWREIALNGSIVPLTGSVFIGWITGPPGLKEIETFIVTPFEGVLCLFLLDMGLSAGRGMRASLHQLARPLIAFGVGMPLVGGTLAAVMAKRVADALTEAGVTGFTMPPVLGGSGRSGRWSRDGQVSRAGGMISVVCIVSPDKTDPLLRAVFKVLERHIGVVSITDCEVLRAERF